MNNNHKKAIKLLKELKKDYTFRLLNIGILDSQIIEKQDGYYFNETNLGTNIKNIAIKGLDMNTKKNIEMAIDTKNINSEFDK